MATYRIAVTYTVDVDDEEALLRAGAAAWAASAGGGEDRGDGDHGAEEATVEEATVEEVAAGAPGPEASIAFVLGAQPYPAVPGLWFAASSIDVRPGASSE